MKIAVLGSGNVGRVLARRWSALDHQIIFGSRDPDRAELLQLVAELGGSAAVMTIPEAVRHAEVVVLACPWEAVAGICQRIRSSARGKIVIDCTNPLNKDGSGLLLGHTTSAGEEIAAWLPEANIVKAFNTVGSMVMERPQFESASATLLIAGDDEASKAVVAALGEELGFEVLDTGGLVMSRHLEPMAMLWIQLAFHQGMSPDFAYRILRRTELT